MPLLDTWQVFESFLHMHIIVEFLQTPGTLAVHEIGNGMSFGGWLGSSGRLRSDASKHVVEATNLEWSRDVSP